MSIETLIVDDASAGMRLDQFVAQVAGSRARAQRWIAAGRVTVSGDLAPKRHQVAVGERIEVDVRAEDEIPEVVTAPREVPIVFEDEDLLVVDKPAGLVVHPAPGNRTGTLVQLLAGRIAGGDDSWRAGLVHRLDRDTSGLLVLAKHDRAHAVLKAQIESREVERVYTALVEGRPPALSGKIDAPIGRDRRHRTRHSTDTATPREAITHFTLVESLPATSLLEVRLETGRTHQIRVHLEAIGHPVVGDPVYGTPGMLGLGRQFLHASALAFTHPGSGALVALTSPLPADLSAALERARSRTSAG